MNKIVEFARSRRVSLPGVLILPLLTAMLLAQTAGNWTQKSPPASPSARSLHSIVYDAAHGQVVLFGGVFQGENDPRLGNFLGDTWIWDGTNWNQKSPQTSPRSRYAFGMAYDSTQSQIVLFGGALGFNANLGDTWAWDGTNWTQKSPQTSPPARGYCVMAYDAAHQQVVLFGGYSEPPAGPPFVAGTRWGDTWVWDGTNWTQKSPQSSPSARTGAAMVYDAAHGQVVLFGGFVSAGLNDTWVWDGSNWTQKFPQTSPGTRSGHAMAYDSTRGQVVLFSGNINDTWIWDGSNWTQESPQTSPPARHNHAMAYDSARDQVVLFGGSDPTGQDLSDTWVWNGGVIAPVISAVVNGASFAGGGVVPGEIATAFGTNLTSATGINLTSVLPLPSTFLNDSLIVNNKQVALFAVDSVNGQQQINFQVPWEVASGPNATIAVSNGSTVGASISVAVLAAQPGIFNYSAGGSTFGAILHANFRLANTADPAKPGETVLIYCTGLGAVSSPPADGEPGKGQPTVATPTVTIGGTKATVSFSGLAPGFVGLYQINVEVPDGLAAGNQPVVVEVAGAFSNSVLLPVE